MTACDRERAEPPRLTAKARPTPLIDNLYVIDPAPGGGLAPMGGAVGRFFLRDRCLMVDTDGVSRTPVFRGRVEVGRDGLRIGGRLVPYESEVGLPMIGGPVRLEPGLNGNCPTEGAIVRAVE